MWIIRRTLNVAGIQSDNLYLYLLYELIACQTGCHQQNVLFGRHHKLPMLLLTDLSFQLLRSGVQLYIVFEKGYNIALILR